MRKFIAQSCAFLGTFRHSHAPLSPRFSLSLAHLCCLDFVAYARWAYVAFVRRLCPLGIRRLCTSPMPVGHTSPAVLCAHYRCAHTLRLYSSPMPCGHTSPAALCAHYRCAHTRRFGSSPMPVGHTSPAPLCAHYRCAHTLRWPGYVLTNAPRIRPAFLRSSSHPLLSTNPIFSQLFSHFLLALPQWRSALLQCKRASILNTTAKAIAAELGHKMK